MKRSYWTILAALLVAAIGVVWAQSQSTAPATQPATSPALETLDQRLSYLLGWSMGQQVKEMQLDVQTETLLRGLSDARTGQPMGMTQEQAQQTLAEFQQAAAQRQQQAGEANRQAGQEFLKENAEREGVKVTESGLQYEVLEEGQGASPDADDRVTVHYEGKLLDGTVFDSSYQRGEPATFPLHGVIKGWTEGLQLMKEGGKAKLYVPAELAYGESPRGPGGPGSTLTFTVELLKVEKVELPTQEAPDAPAEPQDEAQAEESAEAPAETPEQE